MCLDGERRGAAAPRAGGGAGPRAQAEALEALVTRDLARGDRDMAPSANEVQGLGI
jgi:hypothetical protein